MHSARFFTAALLIIFLSVFNSSQAQLVAGPMPGFVELRTAKIWVEVKPGSTVDLWYWKKTDAASAQKLSAVTQAGQWFGTVVFDLVALDFNTTYEYAVAVNNRGGKRPASPSGEFTTLDLWQWRKPAPDFSFLAGSCAYFNEPVYDRPGTPYGKDSTIFETMAKEKAAFMLWLGDNWYTRESDYFSQWGLWYRAHRDRSMPVLQNFLKAMPHFAIWDDHDYGPNDGDKSFHLKETSRNVFMNYWANPSYGQNGEGIYTRISFNDCDFFLMDDRYFRSNDNMEPNAYGQANNIKRMWGEQQMDWLKNALLQSHAPFKFIVTGSQTLNRASPYDCLQDYPVEFAELMGFLSVEKINGVLFLTGDRHHSEVIRYDRLQEYNLYDITSSPLTSGVARVLGKEKDNPDRIANTLVEEQNYTRFSVSGKANERVLKVEFVGIKGQKLAEWSISEKDLRNK
jgi:alkaline phosphatase D